MTAYVERIDAHTVRFERTLPGPIERVWAYISEADKRAKWLAGGNFELTTGGPIHLEFHNASLLPLPDDPPPPKYCGLPEKMSFDGAITQCEPPTLLAHTCRDGDEAFIPSSDTEQFSLFVFEELELSDAWVFRAALA